MAVVIVPFRYAANGFTVEQLATGDERDFGAATDGLIAEGFVAASLEVPTVTPDEALPAPQEVVRTSRARRK